QYSTALSLAQAALIQKPNDPVWNLLTARALLGLRRADDAERYLRRVVDARGASEYHVAWGQYELALPAYARGDYSRAATLLKLVIMLNSVPQYTRHATERLHQLGLDTLYAAWTLVETPHLRVRYSPGAPMPDRQAWAQERERVFQQNSSFFGGGPRKKIDLLVWPSGDTTGTGMRAFSAWPEMSLIHVGRPDAVDLDIARVVIFHAIRPDTITHLIEYGLPAVTHRDAAFWPQMARDAVHLGDPPRLDLLRLWREETPGRLVYPVSGAFARYLLEHGGRDRLLKLAREQTPEAARRIYGNDFDGLVAEFEREVNGQ
ncbi:MAG TPA: tetratricopeptide repeat protein, partial [Longimicrobiales bacterium]